MTIIILNHYIREGVDWYQTVHHVSDCAGKLCTVQDYFKIGSVHAFFDDLYKVYEIRSNIIPTYGIGRFPGRSIEFKILVEKYDLVGEHNVKSICSRTIPNN